MKPERLTAYSQTFNEYVTKTEGHCPTMSADNTLYYLQRANQKLGQLEDFENKHFFDLLMAMKVHDNGVYRKMCDGIEFFGPERLSVSITGTVMTDTGKFLYWFDYGYDWALTKEELE